MADTQPKSGPNAADAPAETPADSKTFGYDVAAQAGRGTPKAAEPNPNSPLAAGWYNDWKGSICSWMDRWIIWI